MPAFGGLASAHMQSGGPLRTCKAVGYCACGVQCMVIVQQETKTPELIGIFVLFDNMQVNSG